MGYILLAILILLCIFIAVILIRTLRFKPRAESSPVLSDESIDFDRDGAVHALQALVRCLIRIPIFA